MNPHPAHDPATQRPSFPAVRSFLLAMAGVIVFALTGCDREKSPASQASTGALPGTSAPPPPPSLSTNRPPGDAPPGMVWIPGGEFVMGGPAADSAVQQRAASHPGEPVCSGLVAGFPDAQPAHRVRVGGFWMDITEVTNAEFERFVRATATSPSPNESPPRNSTPVRTRTCWFRVPPCSPRRTNRYP